MWLRFLGCCFFWSARLTWADARWVPVSDFSLWEREAPGSATWLSPEWQRPTPFHELVVSWNLRTAADLRIEAQVQTSGTWGRWWDLGHWSMPSTSPSPSGTESASVSPSSSPQRTSVRGQRDDSASVDTDTLVVPKGGQAVRLRVRFSDPTRTPAVLKRMDLAFWSPDSASGTVGGAAPQASPQPPSPSPGQPPVIGGAGTSAILEVPLKSQADYPEGVTQWCSPTSLAMLMAFWGRHTARPEWDLDVRTVAAGVHDPGWPGTGNWVFNAAFAGSRPGLQAAAVRLGGIADLRALLESGIPVAASVSYAVLKGGAKPEKGDGHLIVVCGLSGSRVTVNDPGVRLSRVRREFPLPAFEAAWSASHRTAYVVWPEGRPLPTSPLGTW